MFKAAIADHRILGIKDGQVSFSYRKPGSTCPRTLTLEALEFIRRFLQHVLPTGFMKVRYYGFLSPTAKTPLEEVKTKVELAYGFTLTVPDSERPANPEPACQVCGGLLRFHRSLRQDPRKRHAAEAVGPPDMTRFAAASG